MEVDNLAFRNITLESNGDPLGHKYGYQPSEMFIMSILTGITNFAIIPTLIMFYKERMVFQLAVGLFTTLCSFMYHFCESIDQKVLFMKIGEWHRLDNVGSIMSFMMLFSYLSDLQDLSLELTINYTGLFISMLLQEADPWNINYTVGPIVFWIILHFYIKMKQNKLPKLNKTKLKQGIIFLFIAFYFFYRGLDDFNDYLRFFHGMWHMSIGFFSFNLWQTKIHEKDSYTLINVWGRNRVRNSYYWPFNRDVSL